MELGSRGIKSDEPTINNVKPTVAPPSSSGGSNMNPTTNNNHTLAQYGADAMLLSEFEQSVGSGKSFNYSDLLTNAPNAVAEKEMTAYLEAIQRGGFVQPFGCMIAVEEPTFKIISFSENCYGMLGLNSNEPTTSLLGIDARTLFMASSRASLQKVVSSREITLLNSIWVHSKKTRRPFYAILHRIGVGVVIDLESANSSDPTLLLVGAVQSQKLVRASSRLQSLLGGDIEALFEVISEIRRYPTSCSLLVQTESCKD